ncbi:MAG: ribonuclease P protein component [Alphaproteobacteria bacterium]
MHIKKSELSAFEMLTARSDFITVQKKGQKWVSHGLILQVRDHDDSEVIRTGFTVSKKVDKSAVKRNRIKRRLRSVAADILSQYAKPGVDYVLVGRKMTATRPYRDVCNDLKWCLKKTGYYEKNENKIQK